MSQEFDPKKIIDFSKNYYEIIGIEKIQLPTKTDRDSKVKSSKIIEEAFRKKARKNHPDFGGSKEQFLDLVRARRILEDSYLRKIYDQGYFDNFNIENIDNGFDVDWSKIGTYRKATLEDTMGFSLFFKISEMKDILNLTPAFFPENDSHNYEWDWVINGTNFKLVLSLVNDENEVLRLSDSNFIDNSLPFKIYICVPQANLNMIRKDNSILNPNGATLMNAQIQKIKYNDFDLIETTNQESAIFYIENNLENDLIKIKNNEFFTNQSQNDTKWIDTDKLKNFEKLQLENIINFKHFKITEDENAAKFIDDIDNDLLEDIEVQNKPDLPM